MRILVADDEELEREALEVLIHRYDKNIRVEKVKNGKEALSYALKDDVDLCILDIRMPLMNGLDAAFAIRREKPDIPILFLTAWGEFSYAQRAVKLKADDYLVKPISYQMLKEALDRVLSFVEKRKVSRAGSLSESFFSLLRYGSFLSDAEKLLEDFGIRDFSGAAVSFSSQLGKNVSAAFEDAAVRLCHYDDGLRCTFIIFGASSDLISDMLLKHGLGKEPIGIGTGFSSVSEISFSICSSFKAYRRAVSEGTGPVCASFSDLQQTFDKARIMRLSDELLEHTLRGEVEDVRRILNGIFDAVGNSLSKSGCVEKEFYEIVMVYRHGVQKKVPLFFRAEPEGRSLAEMESYLSSFALDASFAVAEDLKDKYKRVFTLLSEYLAEHYAENPSQEEIASYVGIKSSYFSRLFKEYYGINFSVYMQNLKMEKAKKLLGEGKSIKEASELVGFSDPNYFTRVFRSRFGVSPRSYKG